MKNKKTLFFFMLCGCVLIIFVYLHPKPTNLLKKTYFKTYEKETQEIKINRAIPNRISASDMRIPGMTEWRLMSPIEKFARLEKLGHVPPGMDLPDFVLAERTSWWGKRLDPEEFWKGRAIWNDRSAESAAHRQGRAYPPIPYEDPFFNNRSDKDVQGGGGGIEARFPKYVMSEREMYFWSNFSKTHLQPPEKIKWWLSENADSWLRTKYIFENNPDYTKRLRLNSGTLEKDMAFIHKRTVSSTFPIEAVNPDAFQWDYVMRKRTEYEKLVVSGKVNDPNESDWFFNRVYVDHALITEPLTQEQIDAANAWKVQYLNRLRSEQWDESYINAYLQAWDLTEEYVFGSNNE